MLAFIFIAAALILAARAGAVRDSAIRTYAHRLTVNRWHSENESKALWQILWAESRGDPCAVFPGRHDCSYEGTGPCGLPQANPCPAEWRGRLFETRMLQLRWLVAYVERRYGSPTAALAYRRIHGYY